MNEYLRMLTEKKFALIMSLPENDPELCRAAFEAGADAVKVHINVEHRASGTHFGRLSEEQPALEEMLAHRAGPMGLMLGASLEAVAGDAKAAETLPFAFHSVYAHHLPAWAVHQGGAALMAACDASYSNELISAMPFAGVDVLEASIIPGAEYGQPLSLRDLAAYSVMVRSVDIPVIVPTQRAILPEEAEKLAACGVKGMMIGAIVTGKNSASVSKAVAAFRKAIDSI